MARVKICGITRRKDIDDVFALGIDIIGLNFYDKSPRYIAIDKAKELLVNLPNSITVIGVFVNPDERYLFQTLSALNLDGIQFHGVEPCSLVGKVKKEMPDKIIIKGIRVKDKEGLKDNLDIYSDVDFYLLDSYDKFIEGGTGRNIEFSLLKGEDIPWQKTFLAGGITPENVKDALGAFCPYGIDIASGVESSPGIKDKDRIKTLLQNIRDIKNETP
ncbi:MAG: phosphoribosylanthranilate isomerase [Candidatus Ratteibacteria bacterium]